jgi:hypothetical protein
VSRGDAYLAQVIQQTQPDDNSIRTGTVVSIDGLTLTVLINGGNVPCGFLSIWTPQVGQTVALIRQGADWFCLGPTAGPASPPEATLATTSTGLIVGTAYFTGGTTASSAGAENIFTTWTATTGFTFEPAQIYRWEFNFGFYDTASTTHVCDMRLRKTFSTASQQLGIWRRHTSAGLAGLVTQSNAWGYIKNDTSTDKTADLAPSIARAFGGGTVAFYGDSIYVTSLVLRHVGRTADMPAPLLALTYSIT